MKFKNRYIVTIFFFFAAFVMGQAQGWKRTYPTASTIFRTAQTNDNGFIGCGNNEESQLIVLKMDEDGAVLKTNIFTRISKVSKVQLAKAADGNFLIALNDSSAQMRLVKIQSQLKR